MTLRLPDTLVRPLLLVGLAAGTYLAWLARVELVVLFGAVLFGVGLHALARRVAEATGRSRRAAVVALYLTAVALAGGLAYFAGHRLSEQYGELGSRLPSALESVEDRLRGKPLVGGLASELEDIRGRLEGDDGGPGDSAAEGGDAASARQDAGGGSGPGGKRLVMLTFRSVSLAVVWAVLVFYLALDGPRYVQGTVRLVPPERRTVARDLASALGSALPWWIVGRLASMAVVTLLTVPGLLLLDVPLAFLLAVIAGLFSFVPFVGPIAAFIPALLVTLESAPGSLVWVTALYAGVQLLETNLITPRIQDHMASVPPLLLIGGQLLIGVFVGIVGVMFATPLILALMVTVEVVYLRHGLGEELTTPHESTSAAPAAS